MPNLLKQFVLDAHDILERMGEALLALEKRPDDETMVDELFRAAHTLKGNSGLFDIPTFTRVVHAAEDLLDKVRDRELSIDNDMTDDLLDSMDFIQQMVEAVEATGGIPDHFTDAAEARIARLRERLPLVDPSAATAQEYENPDQVKPPTTLDWLSRLDESERLSLITDGGADLLGVLYRPEPECFFKGEDPLLVLRNLPHRQAFLISLTTPYGDPGETDVYRCNLEIQALSRAAEKDLREHFRYMPEQVAIYPVARHLLAQPTGSAGCDEGLRDEFLAQADQALRQADTAMLASAAEAMLDMLNPELKAASTLRFIRALALGGADHTVLQALLKAFETGEPPVFPSAELPEPAASSVADATSAASPAIRAAQGSVPSAPPRGGAASVAYNILATQRQLLDMAAPDDQWEGRLNAVGNTVRAMFQARQMTAAVEELDGVLERCRNDASLVPLAFFLDEKLEDLEGETATPAVAAPVAAPATEEPAAQAPATRERAGAEDGADVGKAAEHSDRPARTLKVPQEKIDRLMDLIGEMVVAKNALPYLAAKAEDVYGSRDLAREIKAQFAVINRIAEDMQDGIMQVRMLPVGHVFQRFPRLVRDVARQLGKKVRLVLEGEDAEADKHIVESLGDPLIHILRNSLDHGLETPEARRLGGKPEEGRILVRASQEGDRVLIEIEDDGKGIDPVLIKRKAFEKGLIDEARLETLTDAEAIQYIFAPGFSTAETVSNLSGRGVGMDVVNTSLQKIGGQIRLTSEKGRGTRILLTLPLSVSVSHVLMVRMNGQRYGVPMDVVVETVRVPRADIHVIKDRRVAVLRGRIVPLFGADHLLQLPDPPLANNDDEFAVLVARVDGAVVGVIVDGFAQTTDVILKPLEGPLSSLAGFLGSALLGDGSVLLVLDLKELMHGA
ncbi:chemotaxis protein CheA [Rhizobium sp. RU36D]|uniref:chemotaxis protein CheA n=1 Tax=Rhizobium sp. RU36D TaxID=1907415 RepID=UPI0009D79E46|nr:chemotaxis protein CheA [Rhizobium sp. RU36D]SMC72725.1 two-component system, chemotaxis family, sensor kinase CheA [Rhizobium sp. RU36D]